MTREFFFGAATGVLLSALVVASGPSPRDRYEQGWEDGYCYALGIVAEAVGKDAVRCKKDRDDG